MKVNEYESVTEIEAVLNDTGGLQREFGEYGVLRLKPYENKGGWVHDDDVLEMKRQSLEGQNGEGIIKISEIVKKIKWSAIKEFSNVRIDASLKGYIDKMVNDANPLVVTENICKFMEHFEANKPESVVLTASGKNIINHDMSKMFKRVTRNDGITGFYIYYICLLWLFNIYYCSYTFHIHFIYVSYMFYIHRFYS